MLILGVDPGYAITGWGIIERKRRGQHIRCIDYGAIITHPRDKKTKEPNRYLNRIHITYKGIKKILRKYKPDIMAIERLFFSKNRTTAIEVAQARGTMLLAAEQSGIAVYEYHPNQVKRAVTTSIRAGKQQVQRAISLLLGLHPIPQPDDIADALAVAVCHQFYLESAGHVAHTVMPL